MSIVPDARDHTHIEAEACGRGTNIGRESSERTLVSIRARDRGANRLRKEIDVHSTCNQYLWHLPSLSVNVIVVIKLIIHELEAPEKPQCNDL